MIQSNELRIGNYVSTEIHGIGFVEAISGNDILYSRNYDSIPLQQFKSIPLTETMLIDFGYNKIYKHFYIEGHTIWACNDLFICDKNGVIIKYVHQLQNLYFALTGKELEI